MSFSEAQKRAIRHKDGPALVLAGPGSGKTTVITNRVRYLTEKYGVQAGSILVITFTRACLLYTSPSPRDRQKSRMPSSA